MCYHLQIFDQTEGFACIYVWSSDRLCEYTWWAYSREHIDKIDNV